MPKVKDAKTKWGLKSPQLRVILILVLILLALIISFYVTNQSPTLSVNGHTYKLLVASSPAVQEKGLGYRSSLPSNEGMLFIFNNSAVRCFWMQGMEFPLDMIWLNSSKQVVALKTDISPSTYPETFCPHCPAQYVLELNAGQAQQAHLTIGQALKF